MARKTSGNSCGRTGSPIGCSNHSMISSITAAMPGTLSSISPGRSCPSRAAIGRTWVIQCEDWYYTSRLLAGILLIVLPTVMIGGVSILSLLIGDPAYMQNALRQDLWRGGHAHAGVWLILALVSL